MIVTWLVTQFDLFTGDDLAIGVLFFIFKYHKLLGRDPRNPLAKRGVCSKHYRKTVCPETPPNFWNPKIVDTPVDEHQATPFDPRYVKD